ncbi:hypothetical protein TVAG_093650 [Trichomonas vaginalis G3]|uniref:Uncharacterized protein n=1 Tax=Trichomonas vaginalis (strain ATCC PRA-98 / G3) TaxID=412133 RepID=A2DBI8_TRIV3|nr:hypothetical protein TVAGG3_0382140 [Trichomonas vaginalis G3]EAY22191.1 hypothetical protein TVAG_093650 [Trichomonas vaginalis G3]KAI5533351.1 hypothetical protein TVAGG3_0382140 [Trichomonas vaginalis G3]|eukprot:XP_001583177.1 hypothetical protein [Trichomonas vaginalis G3]
MKRISFVTSGPKSSALRNRSRTVAAKGKSKEQEEYKFYEMERIPYQKRDTKMMSILTKSVQNSLDAIKFIEEEKDAKKIYEENLYYLTNLFEPLFWLFHFKMHLPQDYRIDGFQKVTGEAWGLLLFALYTEKKYPSKIIDAFLRSFPYFATQTLQDMFLQKSCGNPIAAKKDFRQNLCILSVETFTGFTAIDLFVMQTLQKYFKIPPQADIPDALLNPPKDPNYIPSIELPKEDLKSLTPPDHRIPPQTIYFRPTSLTPLIQSSTKRQIMPYTKNVKMELEFPRNGVEDLELNFPTLLPDPHTEENLTATVNSYNPMIETRSLLHRARKPHIIENYQQKRKEFNERQSMRDDRMMHFMDDLRTRIKEVEICQPKTLKKFVNDLGRLLAENKRDEIPDIDDKDPIIAAFTKKKLSERNPSPPKQKDQTEEENAPVVDEDTERGMKLGDLERMNKDVAKDIDSNILTFKLMHDELVLHEDEKQEKQRSEERILF